jgi:putative ABC transport system permease protein
VPEQSRPEPAHQPTRPRLVLALLRVIGLMVPSSDRETWRREWEAEVLYRHQTLAREHPPTWREQMALLRRASGSFFDAAWLRRQFTRDSDLVHDVRHGVRLARSRPMFFLFAAAILGIGIGSTTAVYTMMDRLVLRALPYPAADRLVSFWQRNGTTGNSREEVAPGNFLDWRAQATSFEGIAASEPYSVDYTGGGRPEVLFATRVTERFFDLLRVRPLYGRLLQDDDHRSEHDKVTVISHALWQRLGSDPKIAGRSIQLDDAPYTIVGVLPRQAELNLFDGPDRRDVFLPKVFTEDSERRIRGAGWWAAIGRLRDGVTREQAQHELDVISARLAKDHPRTNATTTVGVEPLETNLMRSVRPALVVMLIAVVLVLFIACANVANLMLVRGAEREREFALRGALGASRGRLVRQLLTEGGLIAAGGTLLGVGLAWLTLKAIVRIAPVQSPRIGEIGLDVPLLVTATVVGALTALLFGLAPAVQFSRRGKVNTGDTRVASGTRRSRRLLDSVVVVEIAVAVVLAVVVGLLMRSFSELVKIDPGFRTDRLAVVQVFAWDRNNTPEKLAAFFNDATARLRQLPGLVDVGAVSAMPFIDANINIESPFAIEGRPPAARGEEPTTYLTIATPGYFSVMDIPVLSGRGLSPADDDRVTPVAVITRTLAARYWPQGDAVGSHVGFRFRGRVRRMEIVGIVAEVRHDALELPPRDELFMPFAQVPFGSMTFVLESSGDPARLIEPAKAEIWAIDPLQTFYDAGTVEHLVAASVSPRRFALILTSAYALVAVGLAALGIYGIMSVSTRQRTREIGVRLALGASPRLIRSLVIKRGFMLAAIGLAAGLAIALGAARLLRSQLFAIGPSDPVTLISVAAVVLTVTVAACYGPARRATRVDPLVALRE